MHILWNILLHLRKINGSLVKTYPSVTCQLFSKSLVLHTSDSSIGICSTLMNSAKEIRSSVLSHGHCSQHLKFLCVIAEEWKNQRDKIISLLESKRFETGRLDVKGFIDTVCEMQELSIKEWDSLKEQLLNLSIAAFNEATFSGQVMKHLLLKDNYDLAHSFMQYLEAKNQQPNIFTLSAFMKLCAGNIEKCKEEDIINMYHKIKHLKVMNSTLMENVICSLSATSQWEEGYKIYKEAKGIVPGNALNSLACAAFNYQNYEIALELVKKIKKSDACAWNNVYIAWLNTISNIHVKCPEKSSMLLDKLLSHIQSKEVIISKDAARLISHHFQSLKDEDWKVTFVRFSRKKTCQNCSQQLQLLEISANEHEMLKEAVLTKIIKGSDIFLNTTPAEFDTFQKFLKSTAPYDIVIDGLNVACISDSSNSQRAHRLYLVANHFAKKGMKIFVMGRKHMKKWPKTHMEALSQIAEVFYAQNLSKDDPFLLYAALVSGPHTAILTDDLLRNHKFWLKNPLLGICFEHWRRSRQIFLKTVTPSGSVICEDPLPYSIVAQGSMEKGWHIPCKLTEDENLKSVYDFHKDWLCIKRIS